MTSESKPFGFTIFCDDIRTEVGGKHSYIGCYNGTMVVPEFPATIAKFGFAVTFQEPVALAFERDFPIPVNIYLPGGESDVPLLTSEIPANKELYQQFANSFETDEGELSSRTMRFGLHLMATPLVIPKAGRIKVRAVYNGEKVKLGTLGVILPPPQFTPPI